MTAAEKPRVALASFGVKGGGASCPDVLVISDDLLPRPGHVGGAAGLRAWAIGQGLIENGIDVRYAVRTAWWPNEKPLSSPRAFESYWRDGRELSAIIAAADRPILINCSYPRLLPRAGAERVVIQDSHGPRLLEGAFRDPSSLLENAWRETTAFVNADYFICAGHRQLDYFYPWLSLSGFDVTQTSRVAVVRLGFTGEPPPRTPAPGRLLFAGSLLPWTDPRRAWQIASEEVRQAGGRFVLLASTHPDDARSAFLREALESYRNFPYCDVREKIPRDRFLVEVSEAVAAVDVMERNCERDLAFPTRTVEYLWAGLPPITYDYGELGELVARYDAGWSVSPADEVGLRAALREALGDAEAVSRKSANARRLHETLLRPGIATRPLAAMCRTASRRSGKRPVASTRLRRLLLRQASRALLRVAGAPIHG